MSDSAEQGALHPKGDQARRFSAFISYSHADERFAKRLHRELETYRLPHRLAAGSGPGRRLKAIFRDSDELAASYDLTTAVREAIAQSDFLIVVCSAASAKSVWVGREIELFRSLHGDTGILAVIAEGDHAHAFHPALHGRTGVLEPLAADFSPNGGGQRLALLKLIAVLAGVRLDELLQRDLQRQVRRITAVAIGSVAGIAVVAGLAAATLGARADAAAQRAKVSGLGAFMARDLRKGLEAAGRHDLLKEVDRAALQASEAEDLAKMTPEQQEQRAAVLENIAKDAEKAGDLKTAREKVDDAYKITAALLASRKDDPKRIFAHAQSEYWTGFISWREGKAAAAESGFQAYARLADRLVAAEPANADWQLEPIYASVNLGMLALRQAGDPALAERYFHRSLASLDVILRRKPDDPEAQSERQKDLAWLADSQRLQGRLREAAATRDTQRRLLEATLGKSPRNVEAKRFLLANDLAVARIAVLEGDASRAISLLEAGHQRALALEAEDPDNKDFPKQARMFELFQARLWLDPASQIQSRPPPSQISEVLGNCAPLGPGADNREISDFCGTLLARFCILQRDVRGAEAALVPVRQHLAQQHDVLTARWGLNLAQEAGTMQLAVRRAN
jgi:hypothetical protein